MKRVLLCAGLASFVITDAYGHQFSHLLHERQFVEAERAIEARLAADPVNPDALAGKVDLILAIGQAGMLDEAKAAADRCLNAHPDSSLCAESVGNVLGAKASSAGLAASIGYATSIRDAFVRAVQLDPKNYRARVSLLRYYLKAPFFLGGSADKARALARDTQHIDEDVARLMYALCAFNDGQGSEAQKLVLSSNLGVHEQIDGVQRDLLFQLASNHLDAKRYQESVQLFNELNKRFPSSEYGYYGLALVAQAQGRGPDVAANLEKAATIAPRSYVYQMLGDTYQDQKNGIKAIAAYQAALAVKPGPGQKEREQIEARLAAVQKR